MIHKRYLAALFLGALSGAAALSHELLWTRRLIDLLGASTESSARVLGCFFMGLALGSAWSTRLTQRVMRPWRAMAVVELSIALFTLPAMLLPTWTDWLWPWLGPDRLTSWVGDTVKLAVSILVVIPPAFLMGVTLPLLARAVLKRHMALGRHGVWLYAMNTAGGVTGLLLTTIVVLHWVGVAGSMGCAMALNLLVAAGCWALDDNRDVNRQTTRPDDLGTTTPDEGRLPFAILFMSLASGAGVLGVEVLGLHLFGQVAPSAVHAVTAVLASVILLLAVAAAATPALVSQIDSPQRLLVPVLSLTGVATAIAPLLFMWMTDDLVTISPSTGVAIFVFKMTGYVLLTLGPCVLLAGLVLPLVFAWFGSVGGDPYGWRWGWLLAANGVGGLLGTIVAQRLVMPVVGMHGAMGVFGLGYVGLGAVMALTSGGWRYLLGGVGRQAAVGLTLLSLGVIGAVVGHPHRDVAASGNGRHQSAVETVSMVARQTDAPVAIRHRSCWLGRGVVPRGRTPGRDRGADHAHRHRFVDGVSTPAADMATGRHNGVDYRHRRRSAVTPAVDSPGTDQEHSIQNDLGQRWTRRTCRGHRQRRAWARDCDV